MHLAKESLLRELIMSRRLDFNKASRNVQARYGLSVKDEAEWMENDAAARWSRRHSRRGSHGMRLLARKRPNRRRR
jgi:hypothetical protein